MPTLGQLADLPYPQPALAVSDPTPPLSKSQRDLLAARQRRFDVRELSGWPIVLGILVVGDAGNPVGLPHLPEELRAVPFAIEQDHEAGPITVSLEFLFGWLAGDLLEQTRHDVAAQRLQQPMIDGPFHRKERLAQDVVDPVVGSTPQAQSLSGDIASGQRS